MPLLSFMWICLERKRPHLQYFFVNYPKVQYFIEVLKTVKGRVHSVLNRKLCVYSEGAIMHCSKVRAILNTQHLKCLAVFIFLLKADDITVLTVIVLLNSGRWNTKGG